MGNMKYSSLMGVSHLSDLSDCSYESRPHQLENAEQTVSRRMSMSSNKSVDDDVQL